MHALCQRTSTFPAFSAFSAFSASSPTAAYSAATSRHTGAERVKPSAGGGTKATCSAASGTW
jgi:hypothetical protein